MFFVIKYVNFIIYFKKMGIAVRFLAISKWHFDFDLEMKITETLTVYSFQLRNILIWILYDLINEWNSY